MAFVAASSKNLFQGFSNQQLTGTQRSETNSTRMSARTFSRRYLSRIALGAVAAGSLLLPLPQHGQAADVSVKRPTFFKDESGISYYDVKKGTGASPADGDFVAIDYTAFLSNGKVFDSRKSLVFQLGQRQVIPGLEIAIQSMRPGGQRKVVIPPALAYGERGVCLNEGAECLVQPGETLGYDITLNRVALPPT